MDYGKNPAKSFTLWAAVLIIAAQWVIPGANDWVIAHSKGVLHSIAVLMIFLRLKTDGPTMINFSLWGKQ